MIKTFINLLLWNLKADDLETWYAASSTRGLPSMFKINDTPELTLTYFTANQIWSPMILYGKKLKRWTFQKLL